LPLTRPAADGRLLEPMTPVAVLGCLHAPRATIATASNSLVGPQVGSADDECCPA
jgi:hypothetical protein